MALTLGASMRIRKSGIAGLLFLFNENAETVLRFWRRETK